MTSSSNNQNTFIELLARLKNDHSAMEAFLKDPSTQLKAAGIPVVDDLSKLDKSVMVSGNAARQGSVRAMASAPSPEHLSVETHWWGINIILNEKLTQDVMGGMDWMKTLGPMVSAGLVFTGFLAAPVAAVVGPVIAVAIGAKYLEVKLVDNGNGVYFPLLWPQVPILIGLGAFPPMELVAAAVSVHPFRN